MYNDVENYRQVKDARQIEDLMCLTVLIAKEALPVDSTVQDSINYFAKINEGEKYPNCNPCPFKDVCLACIINE